MSRNRIGRVDDAISTAAAVSSAASAISITAITTALAGTVNATLCAGGARVGAADNGSTDAGDQ
jgi:hypothetical protein